MPLYLRKSIAAGPFRFNFSTGGVGVSVGVKGLRIGTGPRGHYVHAGRGGLYYRASLGGGASSRRSAPDVTPANPSHPERAHSHNTLEMVAVSSGSVLAMQDEQFAELLTELNAKQNQPAMALMLGIGGTAVGGLACAFVGPAGILLALLLLVSGCAIGGWLDTYRRSGVVFYDLDGDASAAYEAVTQAFDQLAGCHAKWHVDSGGAVRDLTTWKRNAGASHILDKRPTTMGYALPRVLKSNVTPPSIGVGKEKLYFLPDVLLVVESGKVGAVAYSNLSIHWQDSRFIEEAQVPQDTQIVGQTWQHPNKSGGPDRRFANNRQIPVCLYESLHFRSSNGLNELLQVSKSGVTQPFATALQQLARSTAGHHTTGRFRRSRTAAQSPCG